MIEFKFAMRTEDGTRMFRAVVDGQVCIRPEWMFDPFREAVPCWQDGKVWPWTNEPHPLEALASRMGNNNAFRK